MLYSFKSDSRSSPLQHTTHFSMCLAAHLTCCLWRENTWMVYSCCLPSSTPGKGFFNHLAYSVASYHAKTLGIHKKTTTHDVTTILLWSFSTIKLQARVLATTVGFTKQLAKTLVLFYSQPFVRTYFFHTYLYSQPFESTCFFLT
jgi:hypothetical protein